MNKEWILLIKETRRRFSTATWVPLRASQTTSNGLDVRQIGYIEEAFALGSVAIPPEHKEIGDRLKWTDIGIGHNVLPYAYEDGYYSPIDQHQYNDKQPIGVELIFEHPQPVVGGKKWIINHDLIVALRLVKEGNAWARPEEDFTVVIREVFDPDGNHATRSNKQIDQADIIRNPPFPKPEATSLHGALKPVRIGKRRRVPARNRCSD